MPFKYIKNSLNAGELSPHMDARTDFEKYHSGVAQLINGYVLPHGGVEKSPGTEYVAAAKGACRLIPFVFSADDSMIIEMGNQYARFFKNGERVLSDAVSLSNITLTIGQPVSITAASHGFVTGDVVRFYDVGGTTEINYVSTDPDTEYTITVVDTNTFTLNGTSYNGSNYTAYTSGGTVKRYYEITTPYSAADVFKLHYTQSADVIYFAHDSYQPRKLTRLADNNWTISAIDFKGGPFLNENTVSAYTLGFAATGGTPRSGYYFPAGATGTLTASGGHTPFLATHEGSIWLLKHTRADNVVTIPDNLSNTTPADSTRWVKTKGAFSLYTDYSGQSILWRKEGNGSWQQYRTFYTATSFAGEETEDDVYYAYTASGAVSNFKFTAVGQINYGIVKCTAYTSPTVLQVTVVDAVMSDNSSNSAVDTSMWAEGAWSDYRGWPKCVTFYEDRLCWASTTNNPQHIWMSRSGEYEDQTNGAEDNDAVIVEIQDNDVSRIQWIAARDVMAVGTANKEYLVSANDSRDPITEIDKRVRPQTALGSDCIQPQLLNDALFFVQGQGKKIRAMVFNPNTERLESNDATLLADHLFRNYSPVDMAIARIPDAQLFVVRSDGVLCVLTYEPTESVAAWCRRLLGNSGSANTHTAWFKSVCTIRADNEDEVWVVVCRYINSSYVYYIEKFSSRLISTDDEAVMLDSAAVVDSGYGSQNIVLASSTVRYGCGSYGESRYGGTV